MKSYQVKRIIVNRMYIWLKILKTLTTHKIDVGIVDMYVTQIISVRNPFSLKSALSPQINNPKAVATMLSY